MTGMVIIGAGECGTRAAFILRETGYDGPVTLIGEESGLPYERPPLSKPEGSGAALKLICEASALADAAISYRPGTRVGQIDPVRRRIQTDVEFLNYDKLLLATGARPRPLTCPGAEHVTYFRTYEEAERLFGGAATPRRVTLIGAGLIGMELAAQLRKLGAAVSVVEMSTRALGRAVPPPLADRLVARHVAEGVELLLETGIERIEDGLVYLDDGQRREADVVIAAIGVRANTELAETAGLATDNGILVDERLCTSNPHIFAAGDCACAPTSLGAAPVRFESWRSAREHAEHVARAMLGDYAVFVAKPWFWSDQYDLGLQVAGCWQPGRRVYRRIKGETELLFQLDDAGRLTCAAGLGLGNAVAKDIRLAERLIESGATPDADALTNSSINLKQLLRERNA